LLSEKLFQKYEVAFSGDALALSTSSFLTLSSLKSTSEWTV